MSTHALHFSEQLLEQDADRARTRRGMALSLGIHAALLLCLVLAAPAARVHDTLTEITLVGPGAPEPAGDPAPAPVARALQSVSGAPIAAAKEEHFQRPKHAAGIDPEPQSNAAVMDRMNARLAALQGAAPVVLASGAAPGVPRTAWSTPALAVGTGGGGAAPVSLHRGGGTGASPLELARGAGAPMTPALAGADPVAASASTPAAAAGGDAGARRVLAGASLAGPIADRTILHYVTPEYPDWAKHDGVEGAVTLYFIVRADGSIKENVVVQKTAGFGDFDDNARSALRAWRFEPLHGGRTGEQWGTITFQFRLRGA